MPDATDADSTPDKAANVTPNDDQITAKLGDELIKTLISGNQNNASIGGNVEGGVNFGTRQDFNTNFEAEVDNSGLIAPHSTFDDIYIDNRSTPPEIANNIPSALLADGFTGRDEELAALKHNFVSRGVQVVQGIGGVGKTQLALKFALDNANTYRVCWWINADTTSAIEADLAALADALHLLPNLAPTASQPDKLAALQAYLYSRDTRNPQDDWLLIFNNADHPAELAPYHKFWVNTGKVLITSRRRDWKQLKVLEVSTFEKEVGKQFLLQRTGQSGSDAEAAATELTEKVLDGLPLALEQAAAYCKTTFMSLPDVLTLFKAGLLEMLDSPEQLPEGSKPVSAIVNLALQQIDHNTLNLLQLLALLAPQPFPFDLLAPYFADKKAFAFACAEVSKYALADFKASDRTVSSHRLTQALVRARLANEDHPSSYEKLIVAVNSYLKDDRPQDYRSWHRYAAMLPHFQQIDSQTTALATPATAYLFNHFGLYLMAIGNYAEALRLHTRALHISQEVWGVTHPDTAGSLNNLAVLYKSMGKYTEALPLYQRALEIYEHSYGFRHPFTATSLNNLAGLYRTMGNDSQALELYQRTLEIYEEVHGASHPFTASSLNNLALLYHNKGNYSEALPLYQRALQIREEVLGSHHPDTAISLNNLALLYQATGNYSEALPLFNRALQIREEVLGTNHPVTGSSLNNLAGLYKTMGNFAEALPLSSRALQIVEQALGGNHPETAAELNNLASLFEALSDYNQALEHYRRALQIREMVLGASHPATGSSLNNLALLYFNLGNYAKAQPLYRRALAIVQAALGNEHPVSVTIRENLANLEAVMPVPPGDLSPL